MTSRGSVQDLSTDAGGQETKSPKRSRPTHKRVDDVSIDNGDTVTQGIDSSANLTFAIFRDPQGMYRWTLSDHLGRYLEASQFGFAVFAGALQDAELERSNARYAHAAIRDETDA